MVLVPRLSRPTQTTHDRGHFHVQECRRCLTRLQVSDPGLVAAQRSVVTDGEVIEVAGPEVGPVDLLEDLQHGDEWSVHLHVKQSPSQMLRCSMLLPSSQVAPHRTLEDGGRAGAMPHAAVLAGADRERGNAVVVSVQVPAGRNVHAWALQEYLCLATNTGT